MGNVTQVKPNTTHGDLYYVACPHEGCGKTIRDLWHSNPSQGDIIECDHCGRKVKIKMLDTVTYVTLQEEGE